MYLNMYLSGLDLNKSPFGHFDLVEPSIGLILDVLYYCCYRHKEQIKTETVIEHIEKLAEHEIKYIINKFSSKSAINACC